METGLAICKLQRLVELFGCNPYEQVIWSDTGAVLTRDMVQTKLLEQDLLAPLSDAEIAAGGDLNQERPSIEDHARRVAWLVLYGDPKRTALSLVCPTLNGSDMPPMMKDGHHRLAAALYQDAPVAQVRFLAGRLDVLDNSDLVETWVERPSSVLFGENVLPLPADHMLGEALVIEQSHDTVWVSSQDGYPLGRYKQKWAFDVSRLTGEVVTFGNAMTSSTVSLADFIDAFERFYQVKIPAHALHVE